MITTPLLNQDAWLVVGIWAVLGMIETGLVVVYVLLTGACSILKSMERDSRKKTQTLVDYKARNTVCPSCHNQLDERFHNPITGQCLSDYQ